MDEERHLAEHLMRAGHISREQVAMALAAQRDLARRGRRVSLSEVLVRKGFTTVEHVRWALGADPGRLHPPTSPDDGISVSVSGSGSGEGGRRFGRFQVIRQLGDMEGSIADFRKCLRRDPENVDAHCNLGLALADRGQMEQALAHCEEAIRLDPRFANAYNQRGYVHLHCERYDEAIADFGRCFELDPSHVSSLGNRGLAKMRKGDVAGTIADFEECLRRMPDHPQVAAMREFIRQHRGR